MSSLIDRLLNWGWNPEQHSTIQMRRIRTLSGSALLLVLLGIPFWARALEWHITVRMITVPTAMGLTTLGLILLRWRHTMLMHAICTQMICIALYVAGLGAMLTAGGLGSITEGWLLLVPVVAGVNLGLRALLFWAAIILCSLIGIAMLQQMGHSFPDVTPSEYRASQQLLQALGVFLALMILVSSFVSQMGQSEATLAQQNQLLQQQFAEKEKAEQAKTRFLANMSHEMRTPLNAILGFSRRLEKSLDGRMEEREKDALRRIGECGNGMLRLVDDLFDLSAIDAGSLQLQSQPVALVPLLERVTQSLQTLADERNVQLLQGHCPECTVLGDVDRLQQGLASLLNYCLKATTLGTVRISAQLLNGAQVAVMIEDSAPPLAEADRIRLLDRYNHLHSRCGQDGDGSGLGPALADELFRLQGGDVWIESGPQGGNRFRISLPLQVERAAP